MLSGQTVVVTGAGAGIGRALALRYAAAQATVYAVDVDSSALARLKDEAEKYNHEIVPQQGDVTDRAGMREIRDRIMAQKKRLDVWVNNAGVAGIGAFLEVTPEAFERVLAINLTAVIDGTRLALETMEHCGHGRIVNMASIAGHLPAPFMSAYNASKHGVVGFSRSLQAELRLRQSPVSLLLVSPGFVDTAIIAKGTHLGFPEWLGFLLSKPDDVAKAVVGATRSSKDEIYPTLNGKLMKSLYKLAPSLTVRSSRMLLAKSLKDLLLNRVDPTVTREPADRARSGSDRSS